MWAGSTCPPPGTVSLMLSSNDDYSDIKQARDYRNMQFLITSGPGAPRSHQSLPVTAEFTILSDTNKLGQNGVDLFLQPTRPPDRLSGTPAVLKPCVQHQLLTLHAHLCFGVPLSAFTGFTGPKKTMFVTCFCFSLIVQCKQQIERLAPCPAGPVPSLDGENVVFGKVLEGLSVVGAITQAR